MDESTPKYILTPTELASVVGKSVPGVSKAFKDLNTIELPGRRVGLPSSAVRQYLEKLGVINYSFRVLAHLNLRGGIGKTTASTSLGSRAAQYGHKVVILDLDSQGSASLNFNITPNDDALVFIDIWQETKKIKDALIKIDDNLFILPSSLNNGLLDSVLAKPGDQKTAVKNVCKELHNLGFTLVVIDCPPSLGAAIVSTICAADIVVIPVGSDLFSVRGLKLTTDEIHSVCSTFNISLPEIRILFSKYDGREKLSITTLTELAQDPNYSKLLLPCFIRTSSELPKVTKEKETVFARLKKNTAREDYDMYARHILGFHSTEEQGPEVSQ